MKKSAFTKEQITYALKQAETGTPVAEVIRPMGIAEQTFYRWKRKYDGMVPSDLKKLRQLEEENKQPKRMVADLSLDKHMLQEVLLKKSLAPACRRELVRELQAEYRIGIKRACALMGLGRATCYLKPHRDERVLLRTKIRDYAAARFRYGQLRIHALLWREGILVNKKRVHRLYLPRKFQYPLQAQEKIRQRSADRA